MVVIRDPPPARRPRNPKQEHLSADTELRRIYDPSPPYNNGPTTFRYAGPQRRFDHRLADDDSRGVWYGALTLQGAVVEVFGDAGVVTTYPWRAAVCYPTRDLLLLDLHGNGSMRAGTVAAIAKADHNLTWGWSRYFYEHREIYGEVDGIYFANAHNDDIAVILFERADGSLVCPGGDHDQPLSAPHIVTELEAIADEVDLLVELTPT